MCLDLGKAREYEKLKELKSVDNYRTEAVRGGGGREMGRVGAAEIS